MNKSAKKHISATGNMPACGCHISKFVPVKNDLDSTCIKCLIAVRKGIKETLPCFNGNTQKKIDRINLLSDRIEELKIAR